MVPKEIPRSLTTAIVILFVCSCIQFTFSRELAGPNICHKEEEFPVVVQTKTQVPYKVKEYEWCAKPPFRCPVFKTNYKTGYRNETTTTKKSIAVCCEGFAEFDGKCVSSIVHIVNSSQNDASDRTSRSDHILGQAATISSSSDSGYGSSVGVWIGATMTLLLVVALTMLLIFRYKRKLDQVKQELNYAVSYTSGSERSGPSFAGDSNNPVYAQINPSDPSIPNNSVRNFVVNDLKAGLDSSLLNRSIISATSAHPEKNSNVDRAAAIKKKVLDETPEEDDTHEGATGGVDPSYPSVSAARAPVNPNLYQTLDGRDVKGIESKEPIYEEVKDTPIKGASNNLSMGSVYDRPRTSQLNIGTPSPSSKSSSSRDSSGPPTPARPSNGLPRPMTSTPASHSRGLVFNDLSEVDEDVGLLDAVPKPMTAPKAVEETSFVSIDMDTSSAREQPRDMEVIYTDDINERQVEEA